MRRECSGRKTFASISNKKPNRKCVQNAPEAPGRLLLQFLIRSVIGNVYRMLRKLRGFSLLFFICSKGPSFYSGYTVLAIVRIRCDRETMYIIKHHNDHRDGEGLSNAPDVLA